MPYGTSMALIAGIRARTAVQYSSVFYLKINACQGVFELLTRDYLDRHLQNFGILRVAAQPVRTAAVHLRKACFGYHLGWVSAARDLLSGWSCCWTGGFVSVQLKPVQTKEIHCFHAQH